MTSLPDEYLYSSKKGGSIDSAYDSRCRAKKTGIVVGLWIVIEKAFVNIMVRSRSVTEGQLVEAVVEPP